MSLTPATALVRTDLTAAEALARGYVRVDGSWYAVVDARTEATGVTVLGFAVPGPQQRLRTADETRLLLQTRAQWDRRYSTPGREPLHEPNDGFASWVARFDDDRPVLVIGDGEGRNARAVPARHPVTMVELSDVGARACECLATRPLDVVVGDAFAWLRHGPVLPLVAMLYLPPMTAGEEGAFVAYARRALAAGGSVLVEGARFALPEDAQERLERALGADALVYDRGDGLERVRLVAG